MRRVLTLKEYERMTEEYKKIMYRCTCGHKVVIPKWVDKRVCSWCGKYVFKSKKDEFKYRLKEIGGKKWKQEN